MNLTAIIANQVREVQLNGKWISTNLKTQLSDVTWEEANKKIGTCNTIGALAFHVNYYISGVNQVFAGGSLDIRDKYSFDMPAIESEADWEQLKTKIWEDAETFAAHVEKMPDEKLSEGFVKEQYGTYYRNIIGMVEHAYYHLGQVVILKKLVREGF